MTTLIAQLVGGPTALLGYAGLRWLTDPTLSPPGEYAGLTKTTGPAVASGDLGAVGVSVTALPAQHGPDGSERVTGPVIGFLLDADGLERVYV